MLMVLKKKRELSALRSVAIINEMRRKNRDGLPMIDGSPISWSSNG